jgi:hypothetical protein
MGDANATQPHVVAGREGVNIEALADPRLAQTRHEARLGRAEIPHGGHLDVGGIAFEHISRRARPFGDRHIVGEVPDASGGGALMRSEDKGKAKRLRRLHCAERRARRGREHPAVHIDLLDGVAHRRSGRGRPVALGGLDRARHEFLRWEWPHCVVDQHNLRLRFGDDLEPGQNALLAGRAPDRRRPDRRRCARRQMRHCLVIEHPVVGPDDHRDGRERKAGGKRLESVDDERASCAAEILLRPIAAEPHAAAAGDDQKPDLIR